MKKLIVLFALICIASSSFAASVTFEWDKNININDQWDFVKVYEVGPNGVYIVVGSIPGSENKITIPIRTGMHMYVVRSTAGSLESDDSNKVSISIKPGSPLNLKIQINSGTNP
jgi:hypothetical protein